MLRDRLRQSARYYTEHGITFAQKDDFEAMYKCYHELGKNGVMTVTYERVMQMTPKSDEV